MIRNISLSDPYMYYRLDPGEVGPVLPVKASQSIMHVASHEAANLARMKYDAWSKGGIVVYTNLHLNLTKRGNYIAASSGYSEVRVIYPLRDKSEIKDEKEPKIDQIDQKSSLVLKDKDLFENIEEMKIDNEIKNAEKEIDQTLTILSMRSSTNDGDELNNQRIKEAIRAYKVLIVSVKNLKGKNTKREFIEGIVSSIKNQVKSKINLLT